jgi:hypothetical protein
VRQRFNIIKFLDIHERKMDCSEESRQAEWLHVECAREDEHAED